MNHNQVWSDDERKDSVITVRERDEKPTEMMATNIKERKKRANSKSSRLRTGNQGMKIWERYWLRIRNVKFLT